MVNDADTYKEGERERGVLPTKSNPTVKIWYNLQNEAQ